MYDNNNNDENCNNLKKIVFLNTAYPPSAIYIYDYKILTHDATMVMVTYKHCMHIRINVSQIRQLPYLRYINDDHPLWE